jgi:hypothetical protein
LASASASAIYTANFESKVTELGAKAAQYSSKSSELTAKAKQLGTQTATETKNMNFLLNFGILLLKQLQYFQRKLLLQLVLLLLYVGFYVLDL